MAGASLEPPAPHQLITLEHLHLSIVLSCLRSLVLSFSTLSPLLAKQTALAASLPESLRESLPEARLFAIVRVRASQLYVVQLAGILVWLSTQTLTHTHDTVYLLKLIN